MATHPPQARKEETISDVPVDRELENPAELDDIIPLHSKLTDPFLLLTLP